MIITLCSLSWVSNVISYFVSVSNLLGDYHRDWEQYSATPATTKRREAMPPSLCATWPSSSWRKTKTSIPQSQTKPLSECAGAQYQVWLLNFVVVPSCWRGRRDPSSVCTYSFVPPSNFLLFVSFQILSLPFGPWRALWADTTPFKGSWLASCVASGTTEVHGHCRALQARHGGPSPGHSQEQLTQTLIVPL